MTIDEHALRDLLCERLCQDVGIDRRPDGALMLHTQFRFPDGDGFPIHLSEAPAGGLRLSDRGHTLMHISYDHDVDAFMDGSFESIIVFENQVEIPRMDLARLSDVGGEMISSLDASDDFSRKLLRRVAA